MKKTAEVIVCIVLILSFLCGCSPKTFEKSEKNKEISGFENASVITVSSNPQPYKLDGLGCEWDPHFWRSMNTNRGCDEDDWKILTERAEYLGMDRVRVWYMPMWFEKKNDNSDPNTVNWDALTFDSADMKALERELDFCEEAGIKVTLTAWGCERGSWLAFRGSACWVTAPADTDEYAENISIMLQWVFNVKKYTCIDRLTLMNEPNLAWVTKNDKIDFEHYVQTCEKVDAKLKNDGIRDKIQLSLSDDSAFDSGWFKSSVQRLAGIADVYAFHTYNFSISNSKDDFYNFGKQRYSIMNEYDPGHPVVIQEFGTNGSGKGAGTYYQNDIDDFYRGIFYSVYAEEMLSSGVSGMLHWVFADVYYSNSEENFMTLGLFKYKRENWEPRPFYYSWGLIMKYTEPGDNIYVTETVESDPETGEKIENPTERLSSIAFSSENGRLTYMVTNRKSTAVKIRIETGAEIKSEMKSITYSEENVGKCLASDNQGLLPEAEEVLTSGSCIYIEIPPKSFMLITNAQQ